jgi:hypothetical protein
MSDRVTITNGDQEAQDPDQRTKDSGWETAERHADGKSGTGSMVNYLLPLLLREGGRLLSQQRS